MNPTTCAALIASSRTAQEIGDADAQVDREHIEDVVISGRTVKALCTTDGKRWVPEYGSRVFLNASITQNLADSTGSVVGIIKFSIQRRGGGRGGGTRKDVVHVQTELDTGEEVSEEIDDDDLATSMFKPSAWVLPTALRDNRLQHDQDGEDRVAQNIVVKQSKTYTVRSTKDGDEYTEIMNFSIVCMLNMYESHQNNNNLTAPSMPIYELLAEYHVGGNGRGIIAVNNSSELINVNVNSYAKVRMPVFVMGSDLSHIKTLIERFTSTYSSFVPIKLTTDQFRAILACKQGNYVAGGGKPMRIVESFGLQKSYFACKLFVFANGAVRADTQEVVPLCDVGYKLVPSILYSQSSLSEAFYPVVVPCESAVLRLRFLRTLHYVIKRFTRSNLQVAMNVFSMYISASSFNDIQTAMSGVPITAIVSEEGSTGKTELLKLLGSLLGMHPKGMCAYATEAGLYELFKVLRSLIIVLDDVQYDPKEGRARGVDEVTIKALYDALQRVVMGKMLEATSAVVMTLNGDFMPKNQPVQSRQLRFKYRKNQTFDPVVLRLWRDMMSAAPIMAVDMTTWPFSAVALNDCIEFMCNVMLDRHNSVGVRSAQNCGPALYRRIQLGVLLLYDTSEWDAMFTDFATECNRTAVEFSANAGVVSRFVDAFQQMRRISNPLDNRGDSLHVHNMRTDHVFQNEEYYLIQLEEVVRVICKQLQMRTEEVQLKSLKLALQDMASDGVYTRVSAFYNNMLGFPALAPVDEAYDPGQGPPPPREPITEGGLNDDNTVMRLAYAIPKRILDRAPEVAMNIDFKSITITGNCNFYTAVTSGRWRGCREILDSALGRAMTEHGLTETDDWEDRDVVERQLELVRNMARKFRPCGQVPFFDCGRPDEWQQPDWDSDFSTGHDYKPLLNQSHVGKFIVIHSDGSLVINGTDVEVNWCKALVYQIPMPGQRIVSVDETIYGDVCIESGHVIQNPPPLCYVDEDVERDIMERYRATTNEQLQRRMLGDAFGDVRPDTSGSDGEDDDRPRGNDDGESDGDDDDSGRPGGDGNFDDDGDRHGGSPDDDDDPGDDDDGGGRPGNNVADDEAQDPVYDAFVDWVQLEIVRARNLPANQCPACTQVYASDLQDVVCNTCMPDVVRRFKDTDEFEEANGNVHTLLAEEMAIDADFDDSVRRRSALLNANDDDAACEEDEAESDDVEEEDDEADDDEPSMRHAFIQDMASDEDEDGERYRQTTRKRKRIVDYSDDE